MSSSEDNYDNKEYLLAAVKKDGRELRFASQDLRNDKDVVLAAIINKGYAFEYAS